MGTNTIPSAINGNVIPPEHHNSLKEALGQDLVPRDTNGVPSDLSGQIGTSSYGWLRGFIREVLVGLPGDSLRIYSPVAGELWFEITNGDVIKMIQGSISFWTNNVKRFEITDSGINWGIISDKTIPNNSIQAKSKKYIGTGSSYNGSWNNIAVVSVNGAISGKKLFCKVDGSANTQNNGVGSGSSGSLQLRILINGIQVAVGPMHSAQTSAGTASIPIPTYCVTAYTIPSDGNYTVTFQAQGDPSDANYSIEEA